MGIVLLATANSGASVVQHRCGPLTSPARFLLTFIILSNKWKKTLGNKIKTDKEIATPLRPREISLIRRRGNLV